MKLLWARIPAYTVHKQLQNFGFPQHNNHAIKN